MRELAPEADGGPRAAAAAVPWWRLRRGPFIMERIPFSAVLIEVWWRRIRASFLLDSANLAIWDRVLYGIFQFSLHLFCVNCA